MSSTGRLLVFLGCGVVVAASCNRKPKDLPLCDQVVVKNKICSVNMLKGLASQPSRCSEASEEERCELDCRLGASCDELPDRDSADTQDCVEQCRGSSTFDCGDGLTIRSAFVCDGIDDCSNGADESSCSDAGTFSCGDGGTISSAFRCDGISDCPDQSDERNCP